MNGRSGILLIMAVLCGLAAMYGVRQILTGKEKPQSTREVLAAARDLKVEEVLKPDLVKIVKVPEGSVPAGAFSSYKDVAERWVRMPMLADEPIVEAKLAPKDAPVGLLARIPEGMRAFAIDVNEQSGVSGFVLPDHRVDVILARQGNTHGKPQSETILQDVLVLAAGTVTTRPDDKSIQVRTVTIAVTPDQVDRLVAARAEGSLSLSLRGLNDHAMVETAQAAKPAVETKPILVAAGALAPETDLVPAMLKVLQVPRDAVLPADHLDEPGAAVGRKVKVAMAEGEPVLKSKLFTPEELAERSKPSAPPAPRVVLPRVAHGMRAIAIKLEDLNITPGQVHGGDYVDVFAIRAGAPPAPSPPADPAAAAGGRPGSSPTTAPPADSAPARLGEAEIVAQHVRVLSTPWDAGSEADTEADTDAPTIPPANAVVLEVSALDAPRLLHRHHLAKLALSIRHPEDHEVFAVVPPRAGVIHHGAHPKSLREPFLIERGSLVRSMATPAPRSTPVPPAPALLSTLDDYAGR